MYQEFSRQTIRALLFAMLILLAGCVTSRQPPPNIDVPTDWRSASAGSVQLESQWWQIFHDQQLTDLLEMAEVQNLSVAAADHRITQARIALKSVRAQRLPVAGWAASVQRSSGIGSESTGISASYPLDLWGEARARARGADARLQSVEASREVVIWRLRTAVAQLYFRRRALRERLTLAREALTIAENTFKRVQARYDAGVISGLDLALVRTVVAQERTNVSAVQLEGDLARDDMGELLGRAPSQFSDAELPATPLLETELPPLPKAMPTEVLARRPDIQVFEAQLLGANADIEVARAQLFPSLSVSALGSLVLGGGGWTFSEGSSAAASIFDGGQRRAGVALAESQYLELTEQYRSGVLAALVEIESAWVQVQRLNEREELDRAVLDSARRAYQLSEIRYQAGQVDALTLLSSQNQFLRARDRLIETRASHLQVLVALYAGVAP